MRARRYKIDRASIERQSYLIDGWVKEKIALGKALEIDADRVARLKHGECMLCYYPKGRMAGAACSDRQCAFCNNVIHSGSTDVDVLCPDCAKGHHLCKHCGGDLDARYRRRKFDLPSPTETLTEYL